MDIPTTVTQAEIAFLQKLAYGRGVFEAGALLGYSTVTLAKVARHLWSADPHDGYPRANPSPTWDIYNHNIARYGVASKITSIRDYVENVSIPNVDFAWADLTGQYKTTLSFLFKTHLIPVVAVHDYARNTCDGATRAIDEYVRLTGCTVERVDTTVALYKAMYKLHKGWN